MPNKVLDEIIKMFVDSMLGGHTERTAGISNKLIQNEGAFDIDSFFSKILSGDTNAFTQATEGRINQSFDKASLGQKQRLAGTGMGRSGFGSIGDLGLEGERGRALAGNQANAMQFASQGLLQKMGLDQNLMSILLGGKSSKDQTDQAGEFDWGNVLGGALSGIGLALSDRKAKENIDYTGFSESGLPIAEFNYIGNDQRYRGVIAQDIEEIIPEAVIEEGGYKKVDYSQLDVKFEAI